MKIFLIVLALLWVWIAHEMYTAPRQTYNEDLEDYENDHDAMF